jgi:hypothetical protein
MARPDFFSWGPGDTFRAEVLALSDGDRPLEGARIRARVLDRALRAAAEESWALTVPAGGIRSVGREVRWPIPRDFGSGWFFLELTLDDGTGRRLSRQAYTLRVLEALADPAFAASWREAPRPEGPTVTGPWLRPQVAGAPTRLEAAVVEAVQASPEEGRLRVEVRNAGTAPAYPVRLEVVPDVHSAVWDDGWFWLAPGESVQLEGIVRLDMKGLDPVSMPPARPLGSIEVEVSAWNAPAVRLKVGR